MALALCLGTGSVFAQDDPLVRARKALALSNYGLAEKELASVKNAARNVEARLLEVRLKLWTGRYAEAARVAKQAAKLGSAAKGRLAPWWAEALVRQGKRGQAIRVLRDIKDEPDAHRARLLLGELLIDSGKRTEADEPLMALVHAYNNDEIKDTDPEGLAMVGRAAHLLRAYRDANEAYNKAERVGAKKRVDALLWRADLFLEKYDPGHAAQVVGEAAKLAPKDPRVQVAMARVKLEQAMDFGAAEELVGKALKTDPNLAEAYFVRAGLALRVMDLSAAKAATDAGLKSDPSNLELRSMAAATRFLGEDEAGFKAAKAGVFKLNPTYSQFYLIVGEFAEWEHRYDEIVAMMRQAVKVDPMDAKAHAALGLNLIRNGEDQTGLEQLRKSWKRDKYNVRVFNTLNLYEDTIAKDYTTVEGTVFRIRYHKAERRILERYVPQMLDQAWASMVKRYGFTPKVPVGIELYADSQHFSVRTSGLPNVGIQGVCFGKTLAALSPSAGSFNWGMILWHELGHVFHIQQSHNRVPRWFTEGLAEYETIIQRPEWRREEHLALYLGLRDDKIPKVASFNRAFTHVDSPQDITMAYFAASQILVFLADEFGIDKVVAHLPACGKGMPTPAVVQQVLGISAEELDARFHKWLEPRLSRYRKQFVPDLRPPKSLEEARKALAADPKSAKKHVKLALAMLREGKMQEAQSTLKLALRIDPKEPDALFLQVRLAMQDKELDEADKLVQQLIKNGNDGYAVSMKAADLAEIKKDKEGMGKYLRAAHRHDPSQAEPLQALYDMAKKDKDENGQLGALRQLAKLEQHDRRVFGRLLGLLVKRGYWKEATAVGSSAIYVDVANPKIHWNYARALARTGKHISAIRELNSAILSRPEPKDAVAIYRMMAEGYRKLGKKAYATKADQYAKQMAAIKPQPAPGATPLGQR
ncbi:MAG: tetratricopeptide repeat protein [Deltaproteobacteria bacterium]|nr:tetratricopeptide repeat protein [Deltaproteobacteria bacterium]